MAGVFQSFIQGQQAREQSDANQLALQQARQKVADQNTLRQLAKASVQREAFTDYPTMDGEKLPGLYTGNQSFDATGYKNRLYGAGMVEQAQAMEKAQADAQAAAERAGLKSEKIRADIGKNQAQTGLYGVQTQEHQAKVQDALRSGRLNATRDALKLVQTGNVGAGLAHFNASVPEGERITGYQPLGKGLMLQFENGQQMQIPDVGQMLGKLDEILTDPETIYTQGQQTQRTRISEAGANSRAASSNAARIQAAGIGASTRERVAKIGAQSRERVASTRPGSTGAGKPFDKYKDLSTARQTYSTLYPVTMMGQRDPDAPAFSDWYKGQWPQVRDTQTGGGMRVRTYNPKSGKFD